MPKRASRAGYLVATPDALDGQWQLSSPGARTDDLAFVSSLVSEPVVALLRGPVPGCMPPASPWVPSSPPSWPAARRGPDRGDRTGGRGVPPQAVPRTDPGRGLPRHRRPDRGLPLGRHRCRPARDPGHRCRGEPGPLGPAGPMCLGAPPHQVGTMVVRRTWSGCRGGSAVVALQRAGRRPHVAGVTDRPVGRRPSEPPPTRSTPPVSCWPSSVGIGSNADAAAADGAGLPGRRGLRRGDRPRTAPAGHLIRYSNYVTLKASGTGAGLDRGAAPPADEQRDPGPDRGVAVQAGRDRAGHRRPVPAPVPRPQHAGRELGALLRPGRAAGRAAAHGDRGGRRSGRQGAGRAADGRDRSPPGRPRDHRPRPSDARDGRRCGRCPSSPDRRPPGQRGRGRPGLRRVSPCGAAPSSPGVWPGAPRHEDAPPPTAARRARRDPAPSTSPSTRWPATRPRGPPSTPTGRSPGSRRVTPIMWAHKGIFITSLVISFVGLVLQVQIPNLLNHAITNSIAAPHRPPRATTSGGSWDSAWSVASPATSPACSSSRRPTTSSTTSGTSSTST